jgi:copper chaperone CopZ
VSTTTTLKIEGMTCNNCVQHVQHALASVPGVRKAEVNLAQKQAVVQSESPLDLAAVVKAVEEEGYLASPV